jgi:hypothetical protein
VIVALHFTRDNLLFQHLCISHTSYALVALVVRNFVDCRLQRETDPLFAFCVRGLDASAADPVVPAQSILVEKAPDITESGRKRGEKRSQHTPAAQAAMNR